GPDSGSNTPQALTTIQGPTKVVSVAAFVCRSQDTILRFCTARLIPRNSTLARQGLGGASASPAGGSSGASQIVASGATASTLRAIMCPCGEPLCPGRISVPFRDQS